MSPMALAAMAKTSFRVCLLTAPLRRIYVAIAIVVAVMVDGKIFDARFGRRQRGWQVTKVDRKRVCGVRRDSQSFYGRVRVDSEALQAAAQAISRYPRV